MNCDIKEIMYKLQLILEHLKELDIAERESIVCAVSRLLRMDEDSETQLEQKLLRIHPYLKSNRMIYLGELGLYYYIPYLNMFIAFDDCLQMACGITVDCSIRQIDDYNPYGNKAKEETREEHLNGNKIFAVDMSQILDSYSNPYERQMIMSIVSVLTDDDMHKQLKDLKYLKNAIAQFRDTPTYEVVSDDGMEWTYKPFENEYTKKVALP